MIDRELKAFLSKDLGAVGKDLSVLRRIKDDFSILACQNCLFAEIPVNKSEFYRGKIVCFALANGVRIFPTDQGKIEVFVNFASSQNSCVFVRERK